MTGEVKKQEKSGAVVDEELRWFASPPCMMHELGPAYLGLADPPEAEEATPAPEPGTKPADHGTGAGKADVRPGEPPAG